MSLFERILCGRFTSFHVYCTTQDCTSGSALEGLIEHCVAAGGVEATANVGMRMNGSVTSRIIEDSSNTNVNRLHLLRKCGWNTARCGEIIQSINSYRSSQFRHALIGISPLFHRLVP